MSAPSPNATWLEFVPRGWEGSAWLSRFYPPDLPPEWRLTYFANEFPAVLVPAGRWLGACDGLAELTAEVPDGFRCYLEVPGAGWVRRPWARAAERLGTRLGGLVVADAVGAADPSVGLPCFLLAEQPRPGWAPACVAPSDSPGGLRAQRAWLEALAARAPGQTTLVVVEGAESTPEALRRWWELARLLGLA
jgi:hypothetical protein